MNIFLVPAPPENVAQTLAKKVDFEIAAEYLDDKTIDDLTKTLGGRLEFHCFAVYDGNNRRNFEIMSPKDELLFAVTKTGRFEWHGKVKTKIENEKLGDRLWPHKSDTGNQRARGDKPWQFIYIVDELKNIFIDKKLLLRALGYQNPNDTLNGLRPNS